PQEANGIIEKTPPSAREVVTGFNAWGERALLIFTGGAQPDARYRIVLRDLSVIEGGRTIQVFGAFRRRSGKRSSDPVVPWVVASLDVRATVNAEGCVLSFPEVSAITTNCH
ncbi:MAG TPA: hypothetical protein VM638_03705, partial [Actinomycetota bacterium]|nr:hypothetical protein [Actinomycetota bacterium]